MARSVRAMMQAALADRAAPQRGTARRPPGAKKSSVFCHRKALEAAGMDLNTIERDDIGLRPDSRQYWRWRSRPGRSSSRPMAAR